MDRYLARHALLPGGWHENVLLEIGNDGTFASVAAESTSADAIPLKGPVVAAMPNAHSHAFQRALAGRAERAGPGGDSFWTWREAMYDLACRLGPDEFEIATADAYAAMAAAGYGHVCEFHYLHNAPDGRPYDDPNELAHRAIAAARAAGLGITLLLVLYRFSDFGEAQPHERQRRFVRSFDDFASAWQDLRAAYRDAADVEIGIAPHSLRAVSPGDVPRLVALGKTAGARSVPYHVHVSEQQREVDACRALHGATPIELLSNLIELDESWCLVHATHATRRELAAIARAGAVVALCPTTEANLGDGIFPAAEFVRAGGRIAIGSDSNVSIDVAEELRWLEYGQRLTLHERCVLAGAEVPSPAAFTYARCAAGGAQAAGAATGALRTGARAAAFELTGGPPDGDPTEALSRAIFRSAGWQIGRRLDGRPL